jgi:hypothetical protein
MRVWMDWEFLEDGVTIKPLSVGMVREDGAELYHEFIDAPWNDVLKNEWLKENVVPGLSEGWNTAIVTGEGNTVVKSKLAIRMKIYDFLYSAHKMQPGKLELWGWYSAYDHVCLAQLFGKMIDLPHWCPMYTHDLKQEFDRLGNPQYARQTEGLHNSLADAKFLRDKHLWLDSNSSSKFSVNMKNARNVQFGNGNTQVNKF